MEDVTMVILQINLEVVKERIDISVTVISII